MTALEFCKEVAATLGVYLPDEMADYILWEQTTYPMCDEEYLRGQIRDCLNTNLYNWRAAYPAPEPTSPTRFERLEEEDPC